jgi:O-acetyl-ADP-ribose deacetylase (regulator of RNase III)
MILYVKGDLLQSPAQVLVNTVNTVGVMGRGIALEFKRLFPEMFHQYRDLCERGEFKVGMLWLFKTPNKWVLNFPTKKHWRNPSRVAYVEAGLQKFADSYSDLGIHSIAFPALGCGNGQLDFETQVQPLMEQYLRNLPIEVFIYPDRQSIFVEHLKPEEMSRWLRSEPNYLPFSEVWSDLEHLFSNRDSFFTIAKKRPFRARISHDPYGIEIIAASNKYYLWYESLTSFWQQLRAHGFSMRRIAPGIDRQLSYLAAIFTELEYVAPVHIAEDYASLRKSAVTGLRLLPAAYSRNNESSFQYTQPTLFQV